MARGLNPVLQMKIEDERAGRLDYAYETALTVSECQKRLGKRVACKLSEYEFEIKDGILYVVFADPAKDTGGLFVSLPHRYAVRFESMGDKTIIRARYVWGDSETSVQYLMREDIDSFFCALFDASVDETGKKVWTDSAEKAIGKGSIHGTKSFWWVTALFLVLWLGFFIIMGITKGFAF